MIRSRAMESLVGPMEGFMTVFGIKENNMAKECLPMYTGYENLENGKLESAWSKLILSNFWKIDLG